MGAMKYIVHYGAMRQLGVFSYTEPVFRYGSRVIVRTPRGQEAGVVRCEATPEIVSKLDSGFVEDRIVRSMTDADETEYRRLRQKERENLERCKQIIQEMNIVMELVRVERILGGERIVIYYTADGRIDFRTRQSACRRVSNTNRNAANQRPGRDETDLQHRRLRS